MATKTYVDSSVAERRLRPIYDWLDGGNNKRALQESEKVLKKQPQLQCARVLKALALLRLGKDNECEELLEFVRKEIPRDDPTLQAMTICYREINKPDVICELYAAASKADPTNEELLTHLFMSYVRIGNYKKQHLTAMALYKLKPKNPYYFWAVMSIVMQAHKADPDLAKSVVLPLAERMIERFVQEDKIEAEQEVQLYIMILEMQDKLKEALAVIDGPLGEKLQTYVVVPTKRVELLMKMKLWKEANTVVKELLPEDMDNWCLYLLYLESAFHIRKELQNHCDSDKKADIVIKECVDFLNQLQVENYKLSPQLRGPYLGLLELYLKLTIHGEIAENYMGPLSDLLINYFQRFGTKQCCLGDLKPYLNILKRPDVTKFLERIWKFIQLEDGQLPTSRDQMLRYISNLHITRYLGFHGELSCEAKLQLASCLMRYYHHAAQFNDPKVLTTDIKQNDPFVMLVAHTLHDIWLATNETSYLKEAVLVLEFALNKSPSNYHIKLLLLKIYNAMGVSKAAYRVFEIMDIKHMQLDSLGYLQCWPLLNMGQYSIASQLFDSTLKFFTTNYKDSADHLTFSYKFGSFLKIAEFVEFRDRLSNSIHFSLVSVEKMLLELFHTNSIQQTLQVLDQMSVIPEKDKIDWNNLTDNRDLDICWTADPINRRIDQEMIQRSFKHDQDLLRIRALMLRIIAASIELSDAVGQNCCNGIQNIENSKHNCKKVLISVVHQFRSLVAKLSQNPHTRLPKDIFGAPPDSRIFAIIESSLPGLIIDLTKIVMSVANISPIDICEEHENIDQVSDAYFVDKVETKLNEILKNLETKVQKCDDDSWRSWILSEFALHVEMMCFSTITCGIVYKMLKPNNNLVKKNKKKKEVEINRPRILGDAEQQLYNTGNRFVSVVNRALNDTIALLNFVETTWKNIDTENTVCLLLKELELEDSGLREFSSIVENRISDSYISSLTEIRSVLNIKCKYLTAISF